MEPAASPPTDLPTRLLLASRANLAWLLLALGVLWAVPTAYAAYRVYDSRQRDKPAEATADDADKPAEAKADTVEKFDPNRPNYFVVAGLGLIGMLAALGGALWWLAQPPGVTDDVRRTQVRTAVLLAGLGSGVLLMLGGLWFVFDKYDILSKWLDTRGGGKDLWKVLVPVLVVVLGAGLAFAAAQVARPEERHSQAARRLVYATNLVVTGLLLFVGLGVFNIFIGTKLPNRLDTTGTGFYTLDPSTQAFVKGLDQKVTVYSFLQDQVPGADEMRVLLANAQDLNPSHFVLKHYGGTVGGKEVQRLRAAFPQVNLDDTALILAMGDDEKRYSTIKHENLVSVTGQGRSRAQNFEGEKVLVRELQFLADNQAKPAVYFTQGSGELALTPGPEDAPKNSAGQLRAYLEKLNVAAKPLVYDKANPQVPADAAVVVVANPAQGIAPELAAELKRYMTEPRADGKKGKLVVIAGPTPNAKNDAVQPTGLEDLLTGFNVTLQQAVVLSVPEDRDGSPDIVLCGVTRRAAAADNPIVRPFIEHGPRVPFASCRPMEVKPAAPGGVEAYALFVTASTNRTPNWLEPVRPADPQKALLELVQSREVQRKKQLSPTPRAVAAAATEGGSGRVVVFGSAQFFTDDTAAKIGAQPEANPGNVMLVSAIDWLRDRPVVAVANKTYGVYKPNPAAESSRLLVLPLGLTALAIAGLGAGVWVVRRR